MRRAAELGPALGCRTELAALGSVRRVERLRTEGESSWLEEGYEARGQCGRSRLCSYHAVRRYGEAEARRRAHAALERWRAGLAVTLATAAGARLNRRPAVQPRARRDRGRHGASASR